MSIDLKRHVREHVLHAQRAKHFVLGCMIAAAVAVALGQEHIALVLHWAANLVWIYET